MIELVVVLAGVLCCLAVTLSSLPTSDTVDPCGPAAAARTVDERRFATSVLFFSLLGATAVTALAYGHPDSVLPLAVVAMLVGTLLHPWPLVRRVLVPLGAWRCAMVLCRVGSGPWARDPSGGPALAATLAVMRRRSLDDHAGARIRAQIREQIARGPIAGAGVIAMGLLRWKEGDDAGARRLIDHVDLLDPCQCPPVARGVAVDWLIADAAQRGAWAAVLDHSLMIRRPSASARLFVAVARRRQGEPVSARELWWAWLRAPRRRRTWSLVREALTRPAFADATDVVDLAANDGGGSERRAMAMHHEAITLALQGSVTPEILVRLGRAWDICVEDFDFRRRVRARALELDCSEALDRLVLRFHRRACRDIGDMLCPRALPPMDSTTLRRALQLSRDNAKARLRTCIESLARIRHRCGVGRERDTTHGTTVWDMWCQALEVLERYEKAVAGLPVEHARPIFSRIDAELTTATAWLAQQRNQRALAAGVSLWLVAEADRVRDAAAADHHRRALVLV